jgi:DNA polymerase III epsilon subunit-like protein
MLEATGNYRVLRRLQPCPIVVSGGPRQGEKIAIIIDTGTTGLDHTRDEVIELGMGAFVYDEEGRIGNLIGKFNSLREPSVPISLEITRLTGITPEMVAGQVLDLAAVERFIEAADLIIAHNARFDRPFCERLSKGFQVKAWACSHSELAWSGFGFEGSKLGYLLTQSAGSTRATGPSRTAAPCSRCWPLSSPPGPGPLRASADLGAKGARAHLGRGQSIRHEGYAEGTRIPLERQRRWPTEGLVGGGRRGDL